MTNLQPHDSAILESDVREEFYYLLELEGFVDQEAEHYEHEWNSQSEAQNCLAEALPWAIAQRGEVKEEGEGPIRLIVRHPVFCRATDGFAGTMIVAIIRFATREAAMDRLNAEYEADPEIDCELQDPTFVPEPVTTDSVDSNDDDCPF